MQAEESEFARALCAPIILNADNFTSVVRTPWAGRAISQNYKRGLASRGIVDATKLENPIGESWEFSPDGEFPSRVVSPGPFWGWTLAQLIKRFPKEILSQAAVDKGQQSIDLLVKVISTQEPLSWQIHPSDDHPLLKDNECGKPESWLILESDERSCIYFGLQHPMAAADLKNSLGSGTFQVEDLEKQKTSAGDFFDVFPSTPHALGAGILLIEPQRIQGGRSGKTWRMWDWNRCYDESGKIVKKGGNPRKLDLEEAVGIFPDENLKSAAPIGPRCRRLPDSESFEKVRIREWQSQGRYRVVYVNHDEEKDVDVNISLVDGYSALLIVGGEIRSRENQWRLFGGQSALIPAAAHKIDATLKGKTTLVFVIPEGAKLGIVAG